MILSVMAPKTLDMHLWILFVSVVGNFPADESQYFSLNLAKNTYVRKFGHLFVRKWCVSYSFPTKNLTKADAFS